GFLSMPLETVSVAHANTVRKAGLRVNGHIIATGDVKKDYQMIMTGQSITDCNLVDVDAEIPDDQLAPYLDCIVQAWVKDGRRFPLRLDVAPHKAEFLPTRSDFSYYLNLSAAMETYYGNMQGRYSEASAYTELEA